MLRCFRKFLVALVALGLVLPITGSAVAQGNGPVKFIGTVKTAEQYGEFVCYGSYYLEVAVDKILKDPLNLLEETETVCYREVLSLQPGEKVLVYGYCYKGVCPLQYCGKVKAVEDPYYIVRIKNVSLEIFRINSEWHGGISEAIAPKQSRARKEISGSTTIYLSSLVWSEDIRVKIKYKVWSKDIRVKIKYNQQFTDITDKCEVQQVHFKGICVISVNLSASELPETTSVKFIIKSYPVPYPNTKYIKTRDSIRLSISEDNTCSENSECGFGGYCKKPVGECAGAGTCSPRGDYCIQVWDPVCGCDGVTYSNEGCAAVAGVSVAHYGECPDYTCMDNSDCGPEEFCEKPVGECAGLGVCSPRPEICPFLWAPVCGCDGLTYPNECTAYGAGASVAHYGECPDYTCLDTQFQLKINQIAFIESENLKIKFLNVTEDSRCPSDVVCVWEGQATIIVNILRNDRNLGDFTLTSRAAHEDLAVKNFDGYSIKLMKVDPYPKSSQKIELSDYIVTLVVSKI